MASKQETAKKQQGYVPKAIPRECATCTSFTSDIDTKFTRYGSYTEEKNLRCGIGGFAVKKKGCCDLHKFKEV